jgi:hypothetical protein
LSKEHFLGGISFFMLGVLGLFMGRKREDNILKLFFLGNLAVILWLNRADHMMMILYPFFAVGLARLMLRVLESGTTYVRGYGGNGMVALALVFYVIPVLAVHCGFLFLTENVLDPQPIGDDVLVTDYLNDNTDSDDVVLSYSYHLQYLESRAGVLVQAVAYEGVEVAYYPGDIPRERFAFNTSFRNAKYIILSEGLLESLENEPGFDLIVEGTSEWPKRPVGTYLVLENPGLV